MKDNSEIKERALLVSVYQQATGKEICEEHLDELKFLTETFGMEAAGMFPCLTKKFEAATYVTTGKVQEIQELADSLNVDLIIFDDEISPAQQRNLEETFKRRVIDRTEVILGVFAQRAHTKEAKLQVELAQVRYQAPRLKRLWTHLSRQGSGGSGAYVKGEGEKQIEIDRRLLRKRIDVLQKEIHEVQAVRTVQRAQRVKNEIPVFAFVGYTNVGKSTLLNTLTDAKVFVEDKLFATLDTTTRKFSLPNHQDILLIDTVGFIRKLPHLLVAAFKSTLEEAVKADILLHIIDASHPMAEEQGLATLAVLKELGAEERPIITVFNKIDKLTDLRQVNRLRFRFPKGVTISATTGEGLEELYERMAEELAKQRRIVFLRVPQSEYGKVSEILRQARVISCDYEENDILLQVDLPHSLAEKMKVYTTN